MADTQDSALHPSLQSILAEVHRLRLTVAAQEQQLAKAEAARYTAHEEMQLLRQQVQRLQTGTAAAPTNDPQQLAALQLQAGSPVAAAAGTVQQVVALKLQLSNLEEKFKKECAKNTVAATPKAGLLDAEFRAVESSQLFQVRSQLSALQLAFTETQVCMPSNN